MEEKIKVNYNINKKLVADFNSETKRQAIKKSGLIEILITEWLKTNKSKND